MSSDNLPGAVNQQERPTHSSWLDRIPDDLGHYVAGFVDGEGSFNVPIRRERDRMMPLRAGLSFNVSQIGTALPELLREVFGCGTVRARRDGVVYFEVTRPDDLQERVFPFFERFALRGPKAVDLAVFKGITAMLQSGDHLSPAGLRKIVELRSPMNRGERGDGLTRRSTTYSRNGNPQRPYARLPWKQRDEDMVHAPWRFGESHEL